MCVYADVCVHKWPCEEPSRRNTSVTTSMCVCVLLRVDARVCGRRTHVSVYEGGSFDGKGQNI